MGPYKCPDCGVWWAGVEHRCQPAQTTIEQPSPDTFRPTPGTTWVPNTSTPVCTCANTWPSNYCPIHNVTVTYTT